eukprot:838248_1
MRMTLCGLIMFQLVAIGVMLLNLANIPASLVCLPLFLTIYTLLNYDDSMFGMKFGNAEEAMAAERWANKLEVIDEREDVQWRAAYVVPVLRRLGTQAISVKDLGDMSTGEGSTDSEGYNMEAGGRRAITETDYASSTDMDVEAG